MPRLVRKRLRGVGECGSAIPSRFVGVVCFRFLCFRFREEDVLEDDVLEEDMLSSLSSLSLLSSLSSLSSLPHRLRLAPPPQCRHPRHLRRPQ